jgi:hypothetical protein
LSKRGLCKLDGEAGPLFPYQFLDAYVVEVGFEELLLELEDEGASRWYLDG